MELEIFRLDSNKEVRLGQMFIMALLFCTISANAAKLETTYVITSASAEAKTTVHQDLSKEKFLKTFLFADLRKALENTAYVSSIQETEATTSRDELSWPDFIAIKRKRHAFVNLNLPTKVALMVSIEEVYRQCKPAVKNADGTSTECSLSSSVTVTGPLTVYGNYASNVKIEKLMQNKQDLFIEFTKTDEGLLLSTRFNINSNSFEESLYKFLAFFGVSIEDKSPVALTRGRLLTAVVRYMRQMNERVLE